MFNLAPTLRALTAGSPITTAMHEAHQMARRHLEKGGAMLSAKTEPAGFVVPRDVDAAVLAKAIEATLAAGDGRASGGSRRRPNVLETISDGRFVVPQVVLEQLGGGDRGVQVLEQIIRKLWPRRGWTPNATDDLRRDGAG
jgi:hypothetical protein